MNTPAPAIVVLTGGGLVVARRVQKAIGGEVHGYAPRVAEADVRFEAVAPHLSDLFSAGRPIVGLCAAGILIRCLAPVLADKSAEPPVLALAEDGTTVVPLLGGHHGANALARRIADALGSSAAITTSGDLNFDLALDAPPSGWRIANPQTIKPIMAALLASEPVALHAEAGDAAWLTAGGARFVEEADLSLRLTERAVTGSMRELILHPATLVLGVGSERGVDPAEVAALADSVLAESGLSPKSLVCIASLDLKSDEPAILALAEGQDLPLRFFDAARLEEETPRLANPSEVVFKEVGCHGVAEAAALAAAGKDATLIVPKRKSARATVALARSPRIVDPDSVGRARGRLRVVGIGPGGASWRTVEVVVALRQVTDVVGYGRYLDLVADLIDGKSRHDFALGAETDRVRHALELAAAGRDVALVSSGDAGIYAMAALVFELIDRSGREDWRRVAVDVLPGISALQAAAARVGAPLGHDFCAISLSDLLTPLPVIQRRLEAAAAADFVIALYNPASESRRGPLDTAIKTLRRHRAPDNIVVLARDLGRRDEAITITSLGDLDPAVVDMLTIVLVGNSESRAFHAAGDALRVYTPRGYDRMATDS